MRTTEDLTNLASGTYSVTVNDLSTGCVSVLSEDIIEPDPISIGSTVSDVTCNGANNGDIVFSLQEVQVTLLLLGLQLCLVMEF